MSLVYLRVFWVCHRLSVVVVAAVAPCLAVAALAAMSCYLCPAAAAADQLVWQHFLLLAWEMLASAVAAVVA